MLFHYKTPRNIDILKRENESLPSLILNTLAAPYHSVPHRKLLLKFGMNSLRPFSISACIYIHFHIILVF